jgi:DNA-directed RNA polymerase specialized sigma24 family protein
MSYSEPSTPDILEGIALGEEFAAQRLAGHCYERMIDMARSLIRRHGLPTVLDAEGAANAALYHFVTAPSKGSPRKFETSAEFWQFARLFILRYLLHGYDRHRAARRGGSGRRSRPSADGRGEVSDSERTREEVDLDSLPSRLASHEAIVDGQIFVKRLVAGLRDPALRTIAQMKLEGSTNEEVALATNLDVSTVKRKLHDLRERWDKMV